MNAHKLIAVALAALLITAGAAAATPGASPTNDGTQTADEHRPDEAGDDAADADENETDVDDAEDAAEAGDDASEERDENASEGPPTDLPEPVPDHVTTIHQLIRDKLDGDLGNTTLGEAISGVVGGDGDEADEQSDSAGEQSEDASENADEQSTDATENDEFANASVAGDLPQQAADHVNAIHDAITSFLNGDGGNPGDEVSSAASG